MDVRHAERIRAFYERCWRDGITVDFALPGHDLSGYRLVIAPAQYLLTVDDAANLTRYVEQGGTLLVSFFSAIVDEFDAVHEGGYGAPLREVLGVSIEEFLPLREGETYTVEWGGAGADRHAADVWQEALVPMGAEVIATFVDGPAAGDPAITRHSHGTGVGWYVGTRLDTDGLATLMSAVYRDAGSIPSNRPEGVELVTRRGSEHDYVVAINHSDDTAQVPISGVELLSGADIDGTLDLAGGDVAVIRTASAREGGGR